MIWTYLTTYERTTEVFADSEEDMEHITEYCRHKGIMPGSVCRVIASGAMYVMDSNGNWIKQGE